jgi:hypothetical protein
VTSDAGRVQAIERKRGGNVKKRPSGGKPWNRENMNLLRANLFCQGKLQEKRKKFSIKTITGGS